MANEQCDDGNDDNNDACTRDQCDAANVCGDGYIRRFDREQCDDGNKSDGRRLPERLHLGDLRRRDRLAGRRGLRRRQRRQQRRLRQRVHAGRDRDRHRRSAHVRRPRRKGALLG
jgi:hypothetical protein